jgi:methylmalonyl-CoA mutase cobalamin-binding subunit
MPATPTQDEDGVPIAAVEQATGIARATLRIWERRYDFPQPGRDARGERTYPADQVEKLRVIAELMARGHRPGRLVQLSASQLAGLVSFTTQAVGAKSHVSAAPDPVLTLLREHDTGAITRLMDDAIGGLGLAGFVTERMPTMNAEVGAAWARGELAVYEEHLYTELVQQALRSHLAREAPAPDARGPRVLLATFPQESHALGLLMAQVLLTLEGCACVSLGTRVPLPQIVLASIVFQADVVGLSFTASVSPAQVLRGLEQVRSALPAHAAVWAGGSSPVLARHRIAGVQATPHIRDVAAVVAQWRRQRKGPVQAGAAR